MNKSEVIFYDEDIAEDFTWRHNGTMFASLDEDDRSCFVVIYKEGT